MPPIFCFYSIYRFSIVQRNTNRNNQEADAHHAETTVLKRKKEDLPNTKQEYFYLVENDTETRRK